MVPVRLELEDLNALVTWTLIRAAHQVERELTALFADWGLTPVQFGVLAHLATGAALTQAELARQVLIRPQSMNGLLDGMIGRGLLVRTGERGRGRRNPVALSPEGHQLLGNVWPAVQAANDLTGLGIDPSDARRLNNVLHRLLLAQFEGRGGADGVDAGNGEFKQIGEVRMVHHEQCIVE